MAGTIKGTEITGGNRLEKNVGRYSEIEKQIRETRRTFLPGIPG